MACTPTNDKAKQPESSTAQPGNVHVITQETTTDQTNRLKHRRSFMFNQMNKLMNFKSRETKEGRSAVEHVDVHHIDLILIDPHFVTSLLLREIVEIGRAWSVLSWEAEYHYQLCQMSPRGH